MSGSAPEAACVSMRTAGTRSLSLLIDGVGIGSAWGLQDA